MLKMTTPPELAEAPGIDSDSNVGGAWEIIEPPGIDDDQDTRAQRSKVMFSWRFEFSVTQRTVQAPVPDPVHHQIKQHPTAVRGDDSASPQSQSVFFTLPPELRLRIYKEVLTIGLPTVVIKRHMDPKQPPPPTVLALLGACRRIYAEAEHIFYEVNRLHLRSALEAHGFFDSICLERRDAIKSMAILTSSGGSALAMVKAIAPASRLRHLQICRQESIRFIDVGGWKLLAKQIRSALEELKELQVLEIETPELGDATPGEVERMRVLEQIDDTLQQGLRVH